MVACIHSIQRVLAELENSVCHACIHADEVTASGKCAFGNYKAAVAALAQVEHALSGTLIKDCKALERHFIYAVGFGVAINDALAESIQDNIIELQAVHGGAGRIEFKQDCLASCHYLDIFKTEVCAVGSGKFEVSSGNGSALPSCQMQACKRSDGLAFSSAEVDVRSFINGNVGLACRKGCI